MHVLIREWTIKKQDLEDEEDNNIYWRNFKTYFTSTKAEEDSDSLLAEDSFEEAEFKVGVSRVQNE